MINIPPLVMQIKGVWKLVIDREVESAAAVSGGRCSHSVLDVWFACVISSKIAPPAQTGKTSLLFPVLLCTEQHHSTHLNPMVIRNELERYKQEKQAYKIKKYC